jgi:hypothetical protein
MFIFRCFFTNQSVSSLHGLEWQNERCLIWKNLESRRRGLNRRNIRLEGLKKAMKIPLGKPVSGRDSNRISLEQKFTELPLCHPHRYVYIPVLLMDLSAKYFTCSAVNGRGKNGSGGLRSSSTGGQVEVASCPHRTHN